MQSLVQWWQVRWGTHCWQQPGVGLAADQEPAPPDLEGGQIHAVGLMSEEGAAVETPAFLVLVMCKVHSVLHMASTKRLVAGH